MADRQVLDVPEDQVKKARGVQVTDRITLPFPYLFLWWKNGSMQAAKDKTVRYHGGWASNYDEVEQSLAEMRRDHLPRYFTEPMEFTNRDGQQYTVYTARYIPVALIDRRKAWFKRENRNGHYSKVQFLCYMADLDTEKKAYVPWGPVVLSATGYSGMHLENSFKAWQSSTARARADHSPNETLPAWIFYALLGSVSSERKTEQVGSGQQTSMITPCQVREPEQDEITFDKLQSWFVGRETLKKMNELRELADEWLHAWDDIDDDTFEDEVEDDEEIPWPEKEEEKEEEKTEEDFKDMV